MLEIIEVYGNQREIHFLHSACFVSQIGLDSFSVSRYNLIKEETYEAFKADTRNH